MSLVAFVLVISSCSHNLKKDEFHDELSYYSYEYYEDIKKNVFKIIDAHKEYTTEQKLSLKNTISEGLEKSRNIKIEESKMSQLMLDTMLTEPENTSKIRNLEKQMKDLYNRKYQIFATTAKNLKKTLGIKTEHKIIIREINRYIHR